MDKEIKKAFEAVQESIKSLKSSHEESSKKMDEALKRHEESLKKHEKRMKKLEDEEDEDEEDEETLEPTGGGDGDGDGDGGKDPDPDDDDDEDDEDDEDERRENETDDEYEARKEAKLQRLTTRAGLNDEVVRLTRKLARRNGNLVTKADVKTRIMQAHKNGLLMKSQIPWALANPKSALKLITGSKKTIVVPPATNSAAPGTTTLHANVNKTGISLLGKLTAARAGVSEEAVASGELIKPKTQAK